MNYFRSLLRGLVAAITDYDFYAVMRSIDQSHGDGLIDDVRYNTLLDAAAFYDPIWYEFYAQHIARETKGV